MSIVKCPINWLLHGCAVFKNLCDPQFSGTTVSLARVRKRLMKFYDCYSNCCSLGTYGCFHQCSRTCWIVAMSVQNCDINNWVVSKLPGLRFLAFCN